MSVRLRLRNIGSATWQTSMTGSALAVRLGVQLLGADERLIIGALQYELAGPVGAGQSLDVDVPCPVPETPGPHALKFDLVEEGVTWFEPKDRPAPDTPSKSLRPTRPQRHRNEHGEGSVHQSRDTHQPSDQAAQHQACEQHGSRQLHPHTKYPQVRALRLWRQDCGDKAQPDPSRNTPIRSA